VLLLSGPSANVALCLGATHSELRGAGVEEGTDRHADSTPKPTTCPRARCSPAADTAGRAAARQGSRVAPARTGRCNSSGSGDYPVASARNPARGSGLKLIRVAPASLPHWRPSQRHRKRSIQRRTAASSPSLTYIIPIAKSPLSTGLSVSGCVLRSDAMVATACERSSASTCSSARLLHQARCSSRVTEQDLSSTRSRVLADSRDQRSNQQRER
jgi:hypothetical protein